MTNNTATTSTLARLRAICPHRALSSLEARRIAEHQAALLLSLSGVTSEPVSLTILSQLPRVRLGVEANLPTSGLSFWDGESWRLLARADEHPNRQRFSLAHEYKHVIDHPVRDLLYSGHQGREAVADHFAACLLMPRRLVTRAWCAGVQDLSELAEQFAVSPAAMQRRLQDLGHLTQQPPRRTFCTRGLRPAATLAMDRPVAHLGVPL